MFFGHGPELIIIFVVALLIFGPKKLPEMGASIGKSIKEFKKGMSELTASKEEEVKAPSALSYETADRELASAKAVPSEVSSVRIENEPVVPTSKVD